VSDVETYSHACLVIKGVFYIDFRENTIKIFNMELISEEARGTGIFLHAEDISGPQAIGWVRCTTISTRKFEYGIHIKNENSKEEQRDNAWINGNTFTDLRGYADKYFIYIERNTSISEIDCAASGNYFNMIQYQTDTSRSHSWSETVIRCDGYGNVFDNVKIWDWNSAGIDKTSIEFTSDSRNCYISFQGGSDGLVDNGIKNTILDCGNSDLKIESVDFNSILLVIQVLSNGLAILGLFVIVVVSVLVVFCVLSFFKRKNKR